MKDMIYSLPQLDEDISRYERELDSYSNAMLFLTRGTLPEQRREHFAQEEARMYEHIETILQRRAQQWFATRQNEQR